MPSCGSASAKPRRAASSAALPGFWQRLWLDVEKLETIAHYLRLLEEAYLVAPLQKHTTRAARRRSSQPKLVPLNNALCAAVDPRGIVDRARDGERFGVLVENACLAFAWNSGQRVGYWREEPLEVDAVLEGSWGAWAVEVKTGRFAAANVRGLLEFTRRWPRYRPLLICDAGGGAAAARLGIRAQSWRDFLRAGPAG